MARLSPLEKAGIFVEPMSSETGRAQRDWSAVAVGYRSDSMVPPGYGTHITVALPSCISHTNTTVFFNVASYNLMYVSSSRWHVRILRNPFGIEADAHGQPRAIYKPTCDPSELTVSTK